MQRRRSVQNPFYRQIAEERIGILFNLAKKEFDTHPDRSRRYVQLARKIGMRYNVRLAHDVKRSFCKECGTLLVPGKTSIVRTNARERALRIKCLNCGHYYRYPISLKRAKAD